jgi:radical SAM superfamily enzyme YgiQ (UPF0313 family)
MSAKRTPWVALVGPEIEENLALRYLAASLEQSGVRAEILPFHDDAHFASILARVLVEDQPVVVGLSLAFQWRALDMLSVAMALRDGGYRGHITCGGHFATFAVKDILAEFAEVDSICRQEAEHTIVNLVDALVHEKPLASVAGVAHRRSDGTVELGEHAPLPNLATLPYADRRGEPARCFGHGIAPVVGSRGCYANCTFCCIAAWHEQTLPGKRYRLREPDDVAAEMVEMQRARGIEIFVFHDDNFFQPKREQNLERFHALADALERRGMGPFATVVKARPTDVHEDLFRMLKERLHCIRCYVGIETDSEQGLVTLRRWAKPRHNHAAIDVVRKLDLYTCFNMLVFDPDTTVDTLTTNIDFMEWAKELPFNFCRVELYAGTPLLERMKLEGRTHGDWLQHDYDLKDEVIERVFQLAMRAFHRRNFAAGALANHIMGLRFDIEVARKFHPNVFDPRWLDEGKALSARLGADTARGLRETIAHVASTKASIRGDEVFVATLAERLRAVEAEVWTACRALAARMTSTIGQGVPITSLGDLVATPLQAQLQAQRAFVEVG